MLMSEEYVSVELPSALVCELDVWRKAYCRSYGRDDVTYAFMIRGMLDCLEETEPGVFGELEGMMEEDPSIVSLMGGYCPYKK